MLQLNWIEFYMVQELADLSRAGIVDVHFPTWDNTANIVDRLNLFTLTTVMTLVSSLTHIVSDKKKY